MKLFIDTANVREIEEIAKWGVIAGVTTNPSLIAREGRNFREVVKEITDLVPGPISAEVNSPNWQDMLKEGRELAKISENIVIKVPMTEDGLIAVSHFAKEEIRTNVTLVFSVNQALLAARAGASFVSPFVGRLDDIGWDGISLIQEITEVFELYGLDCEVIAASIRHPIHVTECASAGADIATIPYQVFKKMVSHPLTDRGIETFERDWLRHRKEVEEK